MFSVLFCVHPKSANTNYYTCLIVFIIMIVYIANFTFALDFILLFIHRYKLYYLRWLAFFAVAHHNYLQCWFFGYTDDNTGEERQKKWIWRYLFTYHSIPHWTHNTHTSTRTESKIHSTKCLICISCSRAHFFCRRYVCDMRSVCGFDIHFIN